MLLSFAKRVCVCYEQTFAVLSEEDISGRQEEDISKVSSVLSIKREEACVLLHHYKW
jgi:ariadne-1